MNHLAIYNKNIFGKDYISLMLAGTKKMGMKFTAKRIAPYQLLAAGDIIYLKESSGPVRGRVYVHTVRNQEITDPVQVMDFLASHTQEIGITGEKQLMNIWRKNSSSRYLCWWEMNSPEVCSPVLIQKNDRRVWIADYTVPEHLLAAFS